MPRIFISYSRRDKIIADYIAAELRNRGADVFIDYQKLIGGENFIGRLGREIEACDFFVLLLSPRSVESRWVQTEVAWAFTKKKTIVPVLLEPASMVDFFVLANVQQVDFTRWTVDGNVSEAIVNVSTALGLPTEPMPTAPVPELLVQFAEAKKTAGQEPEAPTAPAFARGDVKELFFAAVEVADQDPEQAIFLYRRVMEIDPDFMQGKTWDFVQVEEARLKPTRLARMQAQAQAAMQAGEWRKGERIGRDMLALDEDDYQAKRIVETCVKHAEFEPMYQKAVAAAQTGRWQVVEKFMTYLGENCQEYGDPAGLLRGYRIQTRFSCFIRQLSILTGHSDRVYAVAFSPDGTLLASASKDRTIKLWDTSSRCEIATLTGHGDSVTAVVFSCDGTLLASASADQTIKLWDTESWREIDTLVGHSDIVTSVAFSPGGELLASSSDDKTIRLFEMPSRRPLVTLTGHDAKVRSICFSPDGTLLASGAQDGTIRLWQPSGKEVATFHSRTPYWWVTPNLSWKGRLPRYATTPNTERPPVNGISSLAFSPDGTLLASASEYSQLELWKTPGTHKAVAFIDDLGLFVSMIGSLPHSITIYSPEGLHVPVFSVDFSPDGLLLASASGDGTIRLWDRSKESWKEINKLKITTRNSAAMLSVAFSRDGVLLASGSQDGCIQIWGLG